MTYFRRGKCSFLLTLCLTSRGKRLGVHSPGELRAKHGKPNVAHREAVLGTNELINANSEVSGECRDMMQAEDSTDLEDVRLTTQLCRSVGDQAVVMEGLKPQKC